MAEEVKAYFQVPFGEKDDAKALGARFDGSMKKWYAPDPSVKDAMAVRWQQADVGAAPPMQQPAWQPGQYGQQGAPQHGAAANNEAKVMFEVPFDGNQQAKQLGARFDGQARKWYAPDAQVAQAMDAIWPRAPTAPGGAAPPAYGGGYGGGYGGQENAWGAGGGSGFNSNSHAPPPTDGSRVMFQVPFEAKDEAKALGARWDKDARCWYGGDPESIAAMSGRFARR